METENNNTRSTADALIAGTSIKGQVSSRDDIDYFSIATTAAGTITVDFDTPTNSSWNEYFTVSLLDANGNVLASQETGEDTTFSAGVNTEGTYYVAIEDAGFHDSGEYNLTVQTQAGSTAGVETENNNTRSAACLLYTSPSPRD